LLSLSFCHVHVLAGQQAAALASLHAEPWDAILQLKPDWVPSKFICLANELATYPGDAVAMFTTYVEERQVLPKLLEADGRRVFVVVSSADEKKALDASCCSPSIVTSENADDMLQQMQAAVQHGAVPAPVIIGSKRTIGTGLNMQVRRACCPLVFDMPLAAYAMIVAMMPDAQ
jgi:hypothetical protein